MFKANQLFTNDEGRIAEAGKTMRIHKENNSTQRIQNLKKNNEIKYNAFVEDIWRETKSSIIVSQWD